VKVSNVVVVKSGRVPMILILYVPGGFIRATVIAPELDVIYISFVAISNTCPSAKSTPVYVHVFSKDPQLTVAENGVIAKFCTAVYAVKPNVFTD
jgi:hypothetical protein